MRRMHFDARAVLHALLTVIFLGGATVETRALDLTRPEAAKHLIAMISGRLGPGETNGAGIVFGYEDDHLYIATANHVVKWGEHAAQDLRVQLRMKPDEQLVADLLPHTDKELDLAVLRVSGIKGSKVAMFPFRRLGDPAVLNRGGAVYHVGFAGGRPWRTNVTTDLFSERIGDALYFESMSVRSGDSGGGLFNARWELIGMTLTDQPPEGKALGIGRILDQLQQWGYPISLGYTVFHATKIAFMSNRESEGDTYIMNPDGTDQTRLTKNQTGAYWNQASNSAVPWHQPSWSPDGKSIAFATDFVTEAGMKFGSGDIHRIDTDGTNLLNLTNHAARDWAPSWSPDGKKIAFITDRDGTEEIYTMDAAGANPVVLTRNTPANAAYEYPLTWSPDGTKIAFVLNHNAKSSYVTSYEIHVMNADGTHPLRLTHNDL